MAWVIADQKVLTPYNVGVTVPPTEEKAPIPIVALVLAGLGVVSVVALAVRKK